MSMAIYLSYLLLEVVMLIRITILNYEQDFSITLRDSKIVLQRESLTLAGLASKLRAMGRGEVVYRHKSLYYVVFWKYGNNDQDEDEVNLTNSDF
jgi:hypothetical protein